MGKYRLTERFTSRDGVMEVDPRQYGMTQHGLDVVGDKKEHLGGATMIFVRIDGGPGSQAKFFTRDNALNFVRSPKPESGWSVWELTHDNAGYNPDRGEVGWWNATVDAQPSDVADEIGLPYSWHVSTFAVFAWDEDGTDGGDGGDGGGDGGDGGEGPTPPDKIPFATLYTDGTWELL